MIWFNMPEARDFLLQHGEVFTLRPKLRREGMEVLAYGGFGAKGKVMVELVKVVRSKARADVAWAAVVSFAKLIIIILVCLFNDGSLFSRIQHKAQGTLTRALSS